MNLQTMRTKSGQRISINSLNVTRVEETLDNEAVRVFFVDGSAIDIAEPYDAVIRKLTGQRSSQID